jgi:CheY-like chemotaxis protein/HPt (histidine-containing phosphotransfer) domain-containing protein
MAEKLMNSIYKDSTGSSPGGELSGLRTLIVNDTAALRDRIGTDLAALGLLPTAVSTVQEGISTLRKAAAENIPFALVVVAWQLPFISGLEMCDLIRKENAVHIAPKLILTSSCQNNDLAGFLAAGRIDAFLVAPLTTSSLMETLLQVFAERSASRPSEAPNRAGIYQTGEHTQHLDVVMRLILAGCESADLDLEAGLLHLNKNRVLFETILHSFLTHNADAEGHIRAALDIQDYATAERLAHSLKGVAATIGAEKLRRAAEQIENAIYDNLLDAARNELETINVAMATLIESLHCALITTGKP